MRLKDMVRGHGLWLDQYMDDYLSGFVTETMEERERRTYSALALAFVLCFVASIYVIGKRVK